MPTLKFANVKPGDVLNLDFGLVPTGKNSARLTGASLGANIAGTWNDDFTRFTVSSITGDTSIAMTAEAYDDVGTIVFSDLVLGSKFLFGKHQVANEEPWDIEWEIVHQENDYQIAQTVQLIDARAFDGKEASSSDSNRKSYGNNNWKLSNIRQWLNSDATAGTWYSAQHSADAPPTDANIYTGHNTGYDTRPGFLYHFTAAQKSAMLNFDLTLKIPTVDGGGSHVVTQKVFLPTMTQVGLGANEGVTEGTVFNKYNGVENAGRIKTVHPNVVANSGYTNSSFVANGAWYWWLSSCYTNSYYARGVTSSGALGNYIASRGNNALAPCIVLPRTGKCSG